MAINKFLAEIHRQCNLAVEPMEHPSVWPKWKLSYICQQCGEPNTVVVDKELYCRWAVQNELSQKVWPHLTPEQREEITHCLHTSCSEDFYGTGVD